jgi:hypothetical protein
MFIPVVGFHLPLTSVRVPAAFPHRGTVLRCLLAPPLAGPARHVGSSIATDDALTTRAIDF